MSRSAITIGKFDGFHLGHKVLLDRIIQVSEKSDDIDSVCIKLSGMATPLFTSEEDKQYLKSIGVDRLENIRFEDISDMSPEEFVRDILVKVYNVCFVAVGEDFCFGKDRAGNVNTLSDLAEKYGFEVEAIQKKTEDGNAISSTLVKDMLSQGDVEAASKLLGRAYSMSGTVKGGKKLGRTLGYPTINLDTPERILPKFGVYASTVKIVSDEDPAVTETRKGITNIGIRPSIEDGDKPTIETFLYDFDKDIYGRSVILTLDGFIRPERKFANLDELVAQIKKDIESLT